MTVPATSKIPADEYIRAKQITRRLKTYVEGKVNEYGSDTNLQNILSTQVYLIAAHADITEIRTFFSATTPGQQYVKDQEDNQLLDITAEWATLLTEIQGTIDWITANMPVAGTTVWLQYYRYDTGTNNLLLKTIAAANLTALVSELQGIADQMT